MGLITTDTIAGPSGPLELIVNEPEGSGPSGPAAIVCHPHPLYGGTMHTRIVFHTARALSAMGMPVLRFNFRGVGRSAGSYDHGEGEQQDLAAAMAHARQRFGRPLLLAGFSFGSTVVVKYLAREAAPDVMQAVLLGVPADRGASPRPYGQTWAWRGPKLMISGDHDEFASLAALEAYFAGLDEPKLRRWITGGDHFLAGHMDEYRAVLTASLSPAPGILSARSGN